MPIATSFAGAARVRRASAPSFQVIADCGQRVCGAAGGTRTGFPSRFGGVALPGAAVAGGVTAPALGVVAGGVVVPTGGVPAPGAGIGRPSRFGPVCAGGACASAIVAMRSTRMEAMPDIGSRQ